jgi:predicted ester cyclase
MSVEQNKKAFRSIPEVLYNGDLSRIDEFFAANYTEHAPLPPGWPGGIEGVRRFFAELRSAFPDLQATVLHILGEEDRVAGMVHVRATHLGSFIGIPATGKVLEWTESHFGRMENGKLVEHWANIDQLGQLQQMGLIPAMDPSAQPASGPAAH